MQRKDLALRVLSTAAIMSIVTSIAAPAFADIYYIGNGSIDVETMTSADGKQQYVKVTQGDKTYTDTSDEIVIKDGIDEESAAQKEDSRIEGKRAEKAIPDDERTDTQELEAAGSADAAGESQPDPDAGFTLNETEEDSAQNQEGEDTTKKEEDPPKEPSTENPTAKPKKDVVYEYAPADPNPEQQATKLAPTTSAAPTAETPEVTLDDAPATPAEGSAKNPTKNVIRVVNDWVGKVLNIRLSNVNICPDKNSTYADGAKEHLDIGVGYDGVSAAEVQGTGNTKIELDGQNVLDSSKCDFWAGLSKKGSGKLTITDETSDTGKTITAKEERDSSGSLRAEGGEGWHVSGYGGAAAIGGSYGQATENITIDGYATVKANTKGLDVAGIGGGAGEKGSNITIQGHANVTADGGKTGAGIGGGSSDYYRGGDAENIIIQGHSKVTATAQEGAAIGSGHWRKDNGGNANKIVICDHATVVAKNTSFGAAIGIAGSAGASADVTIGTEGATAEKEDVHVAATSKYGSAIGNGRASTKVTIQGHATIRTASSENDVAIGSEYGDVEVTIKDNVAIDTEDTVFGSTYHSSSAIGGGKMSNNSPGIIRKAVVTIDGGKNGKVEIGKNSVLSGWYGAISGTEVKIGNNVLLKMKGRSSPSSLYITADIFNHEAAVGTRSNPDAGGLVNTIGNNTQLWYTDFNGVLQKIVHSKNLCKKELVSETAATCTTPGSKTYKCTFESFESNNSAVDPEHTEQWTENTAIDPNAHDWGEWQVTTRATCTTKGVETRYCNRDHSHVETRTTPALGHHWKDNGDGTHTCPDCGATEGQPFNTNSALELRVVDAEGMDQPFTVSQNGTLRTYTGAYDTATLTGDLDTLRYLQDHGAQTIQFVTNGQTSSFSINDLLAQGSGSEVFYLTHRGAEEPTLLLVEADHSELVKD